MLKIQFEKFLRDQRLVGGSCSADVEGLNADEIEWLARHNIGSVVSQNSENAEQNFLNGLVLEMYQSSDAQRIAASLASKSYFGLAHNIANSLEPSMNSLILEIVRAEQIESKADFQAIAAQLENEIVVTVKRVFPSQELEVLNSLLLRENLKKAISQYLSKRVETDLINALNERIYVAQKEAKRAAKNGKSLSRDQLKSIAKQAKIEAKISHTNTLKFFKWYIPTACTFSEALILNPNVPAAALAASTDIIKDEAQKALLMNLAEVVKIMSPKAAVFIMKHGGPILTIIQVLFTSTPIDRNSEIPRLRDEVPYLSPFA